MRCTPNANATPSAMVMTTLSVRQGCCLISPQAYVFNKPHRACKAGKGRARVVTAYLRLPAKNWRKRSLVGFAKTTLGSP